MALRLPAAVRSAVGATVADIRAHAGAQAAAGISARIVPI